MRNPYKRALIDAKTAAMHPPPRTRRLQGLLEIKDTHHPQGASMHLALALR